MKRTYLSYRILFFTVFVVSLLCTADCFSQLSQVVSQGDIYSPPSPNASALLRYANVPVDEHTGIASVVLPIDNLSGRQLSLPITLSYHGSGNKVQDVSSNVGLGFVLNAGGLITRVMRGLPDESLQGYQYYGKKVYSNTVDSAYLNATMNSKIDGEPDMFYFNFLGHTGKLVVDTLGNAQYLPDQGIRVIRHPIHNNQDSIGNSWILKDLNGTTYEFGTDTASREITVVNLFGQPLSKAITYVSSWHLVKVTTPDGKETMNFTYQSGPNLSYNQFRKVTTYVIHYEVTDKRKGIFSGKIIHHEDLSARDTVTHDISTIVQVISPKYLSRVQNDMGSVSFSYLTRQDLVGGERLNQMMVYNAYDASTPLKTYTFNESYFLSPHPNSPTDYDSKRLRLDCVSLQGRSAETKQLFVFSYNQQTLLPPRNSNEFDHWGYYTTLNKTAGYPPVNLTPDKYSNYDDGFDVRAPDSTRMKACILTRVRNINGGYTNFYYEPDRYVYDGQAGFGGGLRIRTIVANDSLGQVTPIVTQYAYTLDDGTPSGMVYNPKPYYIQGILNYQAGTVVKSIPSLLSYEVNTLKKPLTIISTATSVAIALIAAPIPIVSIAVDLGITLLAPAAVDAFQFIFHRTHHYHYDSPPFAIYSTPLNNLFDINGASVTYSQVKKVNGDGGYSINYYTSQQEYPDTSSSAQLNFNAQPVKAVYGNTGSYPPNTSFDFERGLLKTSKLYDSNNNLVQRITNSYQLSKRAGSVTGQRSSISGYASLVSGGFQVITYNFGIYNEISENIQLVKSVIQQYDQDKSGNSITSTHTYTWQPSYPTLIHSESTPRSDGKLLVNYVTYPMEYAPGTPFLDNMVSHNMLAAPIETVSTLQDSTSVSITGGTVKRFKPGGQGLLDTVFSLSAANPISQANFKFSNKAKGLMTGSNTAYGIDKNYIAKAFYQSYDSKNNLVQSQNIGEPPSSIVWGYNQDVPIAQVSNATADKIAYTSFETNDQQYWLFAETGRDSSDLAKTGRIRYQLSAGQVKTTGPIPAGTYILSIWTQGAKPTIGGVTADAAVVNGESDNHAWNFYMDRVTVAGGTQVTLSGSGFIDELRLYPQGAHMSTISVTPQVGTYSVNSPDDKVNTYEYDAFLRIKNERDDQYNIMKNYSYSNVAPVDCTEVPDFWNGINPVCYTNQTDIIPNIAHYSATENNNFGNVVCLFTRTSDETGYLAKINYTVSFTDSTTYSSSILLKSWEWSTLMGLPLAGKSAESVAGIGIDTVINLTDDYGVSYQRFQNRQRIRDGFIETNTVSGGVGPYIAPVVSTSGCDLSFSNHEQDVFSKNDCSTGTGSVVDYTVPAGLYSASTQFKADSIARAAGQVYANAHGTCTAADTSFAGTGPYCVTATADSGTPSVGSYSIGISSVPQISMLFATLARSPAESVHDATVSYQMTFNDNNTVTYSTLMYKNQLSVSISPPLGGYAYNSVTAIAVTGVSYSALKRQAYATRSRYIDGVADGYSEPNDPGKYYLAPIADPGACGTWYYNASQTGFYRNNCPGGNPGSPVSYTVAAHTDSSMVSQSNADALARLRGQVYANSTGSCTVEPYVTTFAGNGQSGSADGSALTAEFIAPMAMAIDGNGNIYVVDNYSKIKKITPDGTVSTFAGSDASGYANGTGTAARFNSITGITTDASGNVYVCEAAQFDIKKITPAGVVTTLAISNLNFYHQFGGMSTDASGNLYIAANPNHIIKVTQGGVVSTFAGAAAGGTNDGQLTTAQFSNVSAIGIDRTGNMYCADNNNLRKLSNGYVSTVAHSVFGVKQMVFDASNTMYWIDGGRNVLCKLTPSGIPIIISDGGGYRNGPLSTASFYPIWGGITIDASGNIYIADAHNHVIRKITFPH
jgi:hypothetical protein